jgi:cytochrome P450
MSLHLLASSLSFNLLALLPVGLAIYTFGLIVYRIFFHPLSRYPGPLLAKLTDLHSTYHALKGDRHLEFHRCHEKYGPIYRFGPNSVSFNSATALKDIYGFKSNVQKASFYQAFWASKDAFSTHSSIDKGIHARKRRVLSQAFSDSAIKSMENHVLAHIRQFCANLSGYGQASSVAPQYSDLVVAKSGSGDFGPTVDMTNQANYLAFDIMGKLFARLRIL